MQFASTAVNLSKEWLTSISLRTGSTIWLALIVLLLQGCQPAQNLEKVDDLSHARPAAPHSSSPRDTNVAEITGRTIPKYTEVRIRGYFSAPLDHETKICKVFASPQNDASFVDVNWDRSNIEATFDEHDPMPDTQYVISGRLLEYLSGPTQGKLYLMADQIAPSSN